MPSKNNFPLSNAALESKMAAFIKDRSAQNLAAILQLLPAAGLFLTMAASTPQARQALKNGDTLSPQMRKDLHPIILKTQKGEDFLPAYTSPKAIPKQENSMVICLPFGAVCQTVTRNPTLTGLVLNPFGENVILRRDLLEKAFRSSSSNPGSANSDSVNPNARGPQGTNIVLQNPRPFPQEMAEAACAVLREYPCVSAAYVQHLSADDRRAFLFLLETDGTGDRKELEEKIRTATEEAAFGFPVEFCDAGAMRAQLEANNAKPFYKK